jgi:hypothetical protein
VTSPLRRLLLAAVVVAAVAAGAFVATRALDTDATSSSGNASPTPAPGAAGTATGVDAARTATEPIETDPPADFATDAPQTPTSGPADVVLTYAGWDAASGTVQAGGYVGGRVESGGTCTLTLTRGAETQTASGPASADASTTICESVILPGGQVSAGRWQAVLSYSSPAAEGRSTALDVDVP